MSSGRASARTRLPVDERREGLVRSGLDLFGERPYETISVEAIAEAAGISRGLLYHYFPGKRDFYVAVVRAAVEELLDLIEPDPELDPPAQLQVSLRAYFDFVLRRRAGFLAVTQSGDPVVAAETDRIRSRVVDLVAAGSGVHTPAARVGLRGWVGYLEGLAGAWLTGEQVDIDELVRLATATLAVTLAA